MLRRFLTLQVKETTVIVVEYPRRLAALVRDRAGPLVKVCLAADAPADVDMLSRVYLRAGYVPACIADYK